MVARLVLAPPLLDLLMARGRDRNGESVVEFFVAEGWRSQKSERPTWFSEA